MLLTPKQGGASEVVRASPFTMLRGPSVTNSTPLVSVGLFVYNGERFIEEALHSILNQTFTDFELIISDNASKTERARSRKPMLSATTASAIIETRRT